MQFPNPVQRGVHIGLRRCAECVLSDSRCMGQASFYVLAHSFLPFHFCVLPAFCKVDHRAITTSLCALTRGMLEDAPASSFKPTAACGAQSLQTARYCNLTLATAVRASTRQSASLFAFGIKSGDSTSNRRVPQPRPKSLYKTTFPTPHVGCV